MALGTLLERLFIAISADLTGLVSGVDKGVAAVDAAALELNRSWQKVENTFDEVGIAAARNFQMIARETASMAAAAQSYAIAQGRAFSSIHRQTNNMDKFGRSLGQTRSQLTNLGFQVQDIGVSLASGMNPLLILIQQGSQIQQIYSGTGGGIGAMFSDMGKFATRLAPLALVVGAIAGGFALLTNAIQGTTDVQVQFGDVVLATFQVAAKAIWDWLEGPVKSIVEWFKPIGQWLMDLFKTVTNAIIGSFVFAFNAVKNTWGLLPAAMGDIVAMTVNSVIEGTEMMVNAVIGKINELATFINQGSEFLGMGKIFGELSEANLDAWKMEVSGAASDVGTIIQEELTKAFSQDYVGMAFEAIRDQAIENALKRIAAETDNIGSAAEKTGKKIKEEIVTPLMKAADNLAGVFGNAFEEIANTGKFTFGNFINDLNRLLIDSVSSSLQKNLSSLFQNIFAGGASGGGNILGDIFTSIFGGFKAGGGVVMPWKSFVAGERGAELINRDGPGGASRVTPAGRTRSLLNAGASGAPVSVTFNMPPGTDMTTFRRSEGQIASMIGRAVDRGRRNQ